MLRIAAHVLGDVDRWWTRHGGNLHPGLELGDVYKLLHQVAIEAAAGWSLLPDRGDGTRVFTARAALDPISLLLVEHGDDLIVWDVRFPPQR